MYVKSQTAARRGKRYAASQKPREATSSPTREVLYAMNGVVDTLAAKDDAGSSTLHRRIETDLHPRLHPFPSSGSLAKPPSNQTPATREDIAKNALYHQPLSPEITDIEILFPDLEKKKPAKVIEILTRKFSDNPTPAHGSLLQLTMNRYTSSGAIDSELKLAIEEAKRAFHKPSKSSAKAPGGTDDISYTAWVNDFYGGASQFYDLPQGYILGGYRWVGSAMNDKITSLQAQDSSNELGAHIVFFENSGWWGRYMNWILSQGPGTNDVPNVGSWFNDITSSTLIIRQFPNENRPVTLSNLLNPSLFTNLWNYWPTIPNQTISPQAEPVIYTWDLLPTGPTSGDDWHPDAPNMIFIYIIVPVYVFNGNVDDPAEVRYWYYLYVDGDGNMSGYTYAWGYWYGSSNVQAYFTARIQATIPTVNSFFAPIVEFFRLAGPYRFLYYLPGRNASSGNTFDDVTIVTVRTGD